MPATNDRISRVLLRFEVDRASLAVIEQAMKQEQALLQGMTAEEAQALDVSIQLNKALQDIGRNNEIDALGAKFGQMAQAEQLTALAAQRLRDRLVEIGATAPEVERAAQAFAAAQAGGADAAGAGLQSQVRLFGSKLRALPSVQLGGGLSSDAIANIIRLVGSLPAPLLAAGAAIAIVVAGIAVLNKSLEGAKKAYEQAAKSSQAYYDAIGGQTTTEEAIKRIKELQTQIAAEQDALGNQQRAQADAFQSAQENLFGGDVTARVAFALGQIGDGAEESQKKISDWQAELGGLQRAVDDNALADADAAKAAEAAAEAQAKFNEQLYKYAQDTIGVQIDTQKKLYDLYLNGTEKQLDQTIADAREQINLTGSRIDKERELLQTYKAGSAQYEETSQLIEDLNHQQLDLINSLNALSDASVRDAVQMNDAAVKQDQIRQQSAVSYEKYSEDVAKIQADGLEKQAGIEQDYQDKLVSIAQDTADKEATLLQQLGEKRVDLATKFAQTEADALQKLQYDNLDRQIKYQRDEAEAAKKHADDLVKIQKDAQEREFNLILTRDFAGLFKSRRETTQQIEDSNTQYQDQRSGRLQAFQDENDDAQRHFAEQEQQRQLNYQRELQQAQIQYQRQVAAAEKNKADLLQKAYDGYRQELALLAQKQAQELQARQQAEVAELQLIAQGDAQKLELERQYYAQSMAFIQAMAAQVGQALQAGFGAGTTGTGSYGGSGNAITGGIGALFGGASVSNRSQSNTFNIQGNNPAAIAGVVQPLITRAFQEFFG